MSLERDSHSTRRVVTLLGKVQTATNGIVVTSKWNEANAITLSSESTLFLLRCCVTRVNKQSAWLVVPLNPQGKVKLPPNLCLLVMAEQDSVFRSVKITRGGLVIKDRIMSRGLA